MFKINHNYSAREIANLVDPSTKNKKRIAGEFATSLYFNNKIAVIQMNIGVPGRTGHKFDNLYNKFFKMITWFGRPGSNSEHKKIKKLISEKKNPHFFARWNNKDKYKFLGQAKLLGYIDGIPCLDGKKKLSKTIEMKFLII